MTKDGYVPLSVIANFNRVQSLCPDIYLIADVRLKHLFDPLTFFALFRPFAIVPLLN